MSETTPYFPTIEAVESAAKNLEGVAKIYKSFGPTKLEVLTTKCPL